jgi:non-reducing end alpha-L-arabinofuranosidase
MRGPFALQIVACVAAALAAIACGRAPGRSDAGAGGGGSGGVAGTAVPPNDGGGAVGAGGVGTADAGAAGTGGAGTAGTAGTGGGGGVGTADAGPAGTGGAGTAGVGNVAGAGGDAGRDAGGGGTGGATFVFRGPCDVYGDAGTPCVAAYSTVRRLLSTYAGPLYQVRSGSSDQNTGSGGETHDIGQTADGFADAAAVDAACTGTICTVSLLYDQSGKGNHLSVAKAGNQGAGPNAATDDFESSATKESLMVGGRRVYSLYMEPRQGYRLPRLGDGIPRGTEPLGIYMLADGTRAGVGCCWDFGNSPPRADSFTEANALFYGSGLVSSSTGAAIVGAGDGPWFMFQIGTEVWAGGSATAFSNNPNNPSLKVKFALGFLKIDGRTLATRKWALRMADATSATVVTTAHEGALPKPVSNGGAVVLGVSQYNSNDSWGTFYEGALLAGFPADDTEVAILRNIQAIGYGK